MKINFSTSFLFLFIICCLEISAQKEVQPEKFTSLSLNDCIDIALANNKFHAAAQTSIEIAETQLNQAESGYWPQLSLKAAFTTMDEDPLFGQPSFVFNMSDMQLPIQIPPINVPEQKIKLMDKSNLNTSLDLIYPLYTGGLVSSVVKQAESGLNVSKQELRKTDLQIVYNVKKIYNSLILTNRLYDIGKETLQRLEATLSLTETLYKKGSGKVKKTDYLRNKTIVESVKSIVIDLENKEKIAGAALINALGLKWNTVVQISDTNIAFDPYVSDLNSFINESFNTNPDWAKIKFGIEAADAKINETYSGYLPKFALIGNFTQIINSYDKGYVLPENNTAWRIGLGMEISLFSGFLTNNKVKEAEARLKKLQHEQVLLEEGLAMQIQNLFYQMQSAREQVIASRGAMEAAIENRELNERAYQEDLIEVKDLIESQVMESLMKANHQKFLYDHSEIKAHLDFIVGSELNKLGKIEKY